jgi:hypothetical protein
MWEFVGDDSNNGDWKKPWMENNKERRAWIA